MFGFLKKKLSNAVEALTRKQQEEEKFEEKIETAEEVIEKKPEKIKEEIKELPQVKSEVIEEIKEKPEEKTSLLKKIVKKITERKLNEEDIDPILAELENGLIEADVAYQVAKKIKTDLKKALLDQEFKIGETQSVVVNNLKGSLMEILNVKPIDLIERGRTKKPYIILFLGFNGSGKTTTLAKMGKWILDQNLSCVFAAADTFRAASLEQLEEHANKIGVDIIKHKYGADPAAVAFDAISHAKSKGIHFVLIDTAGRIHTNVNLMDEMEKIIRVNKPDLKVLVIDSMTGNDAVLQARAFNEVGVDAVIFTKIDVNEKGGAILSVTYELKKPILFLSNGQDHENLITFNAKEFVDNLISE